MIASWRAGNKPVLSEYLLPAARQLAITPRYIPQAVKAFEAIAASHGTPIQRRWDAARSIVHYANILPPEHSVRAFAAAASVCTRSHPQRVAALAGIRRNALRLQDSGKRREALELAWRIEWFARPLHPAKKTL